VVPAASVEEEAAAEILQGGRQRSLASPVLARVVGERRAMRIGSQPFIAGRGQGELVYVISNDELERVDVDMGLCAFRETRIIVVAGLSEQGGAMTVESSSSEQSELLAQGFLGEVIWPGDAGYDQARTVHNGLIDRRPGVIARCRGTADIAAALALARESGLEVSVRGGGHNVAGRAVTEGGVMVDLSLMRGIYVDPAAGRLRAQGGVTWGELNREAALHGLAVTGGAISTTGIGGYTLGGGLGWLMSTQGLAADNLTGVELVISTGEVLNVSDDSHPDLMWALRGGGGNFGVAASLEYRVRPLQMITGGLIAHPFEVAGEMLRFYREAAAATPDDLTVWAGVVHAPDGSGMKLCAMVVCHVGDSEAAEHDLAPFMGFGSPVMVEVGPMPYPVINTLLDDAYPAGSLNYWLSSFTAGLSDGLIDTCIERFATTPSPMNAILFEHFHGAVTRIGATDTAVPHRDAGWNMLIPSVWLDPADTNANVQWTRDTFAAVGEHLVSRRWLNYLGDDQNDAIRDAYGPNYDRLVQVKRSFDPDNVFHLNHNITP
jgi:FAD/FMN-containing dehydrogenase